MNNIVLQNLLMQVYVNLQIYIILDIKMYCIGVKYIIWNVKTILYS